MKVDISYCYLKKYNKLFFNIHTTAEEKNEKIYELPVFSYFSENISKLQNDEMFGLKFCEYSDKLKDDIFEIIRNIANKLKTEQKNIVLNIDIYEIQGDTF